MLGSARKFRLIIREIILEEFQRVWSQSTNFTNGQTDRQTTYHDNTFTWIGGQLSAVKSTQCLCVKCRTVKCPAAKSPAVKWGRSNVVDPLTISVVSSPRGVRAELRPKMILCIFQVRNKPYLSDGGPPQTSRGPEKLSPFRPSLRACALPCKNWMFNCANLFSAISGTDAISQWRKISGFVEKFRLMTE